MSHAVRVLGSISGSSLDGLDLALCTYQKDSDDKLIWFLEQTETIAYSDIWQSRLRSAPQLSGIALTQLDADYSYLVAELIEKFLVERSLTADYIAVHGHTIFHGPKQGYTLQIGNGGYISSTLKISTISDFRSQDIGLGGQGAPIAPIVEKALFPGHDFYLNLGGICNLTSVSAQQYIAYDVCGCNQMLNALASIRGMDYDKDGEIASKGKMNQDALSILEAPDYYQKSWPKSLDNTWVKTNLTDKLMSLQMVSVEDRMYTSCHHIVKEITRAVQKHLEGSGAILRSMFATGGGVLNTFLTQMLSKELDKNGVQLICPDQQIVEYKEAILMALMGYLRIHKQENIIHTVTGARGPSVAGALYHYNHDSD